MSASDYRSVRAPPGSYAAYARERCASQENLTIKVGDTPSVQTGAGGVWLNVKLWVTDSSAATMQTAVLADNGLRAADNGLKAPAEVAQPEPVASNSTNKANEKWRVSDSIGTRHFRGTSLESSTG